jgi:flagellar hook-associated protein 3 FlgL
MRISQTQYQATMIGALQDAQSRLSTLTAQMASGKALMLPSDDPLTSVRLSRLRREDAAVGQYRDNIAALKSRLTASEGNLDSLTGDMSQARDLMVSALDGSNSSSNLHAFGQELQSLIDSLHNTVNIKDSEGRYLFSGTATGTPTVSYDPSAPVGSRYGFTGNTAQQRVVVGFGTTQPANVSLPEMADLLNRLEAGAVAMNASADNTPDATARAAMTDALNALDGAADSVGSRIARLGGTQNLLSTLDTNHANVSLSNQQGLIDMGQLDYGAAAVQLDAFDTALAASQKAYAKVSGLSLFDLL